MHKLIPLLVLAATAAGSAQQTAPQSPPTGTGVIRGRVVDAVSAAPVPDAEVSFSPDMNRTRRSTRSDAQGTFVLEQAPAGSLYISASKAGYAGGTYGQRSVHSTHQLFDLAPGEQVGDVELRIWKYATLSGRVLGPDGQPIAGATIRAMRLEIVNGVKAFTSGPTAVTDRNGHYELARVLPATYGIALMSMATPSYQGGAGASQILTGYPTTFYPGVLRSDRASLMTVETGADRRDIDFALKRIPTFSVSGSIQGLPPPDRRQRQIELTLAETMTPASPLSVVTAALTADGRFEWSRVPPGDYVAKTVVFPMAEPAPGTRSISQTVSGTGMGMAYSMLDKTLPISPLSASPTLMGTARISVSDRDLTGIAIALRPAGRISGRIAFVGAASKPTAQQLLATPVAIIFGATGNFGAFPIGRVEADGRFSTVGVPPGRYSVVFLNTEFMMSTAAWDPPWRMIPSGGNVEVADADVTGITYTFTDELATFAARISGLVRDAAGTLRPDATIYVFPANQDGWARGALREVRPGRTGRYSVPDLPAGEYFIAVASDAPDLWREIEYLKRLSASALRVTLAAGESRTIDLTVR